MAVTNNFSASTLDLNGQVGLSQPTALVWGPDGRLYITEVDGDVKVLTVAFGDKNPADADPTPQFYVTDAVTVDLIKGAIQNHNDDGTENGGVNRQVTGIDVTAQYDAGGALMTLPDGTPMVTMYVTSSDSRIGAGENGNDSNLDTNSGVITMMTQTGPDSWTAIDIVRGLPRSEENHATNGLEVIQEFDANGLLVSERMIVASGGNANTGAPSNNFAGQEEQPLSAAILEVDLTMLKGMPVLNDDGRAYIYDLPTLNDPSRPDAADGTEANDPFGGNDSKNSAKLLDLGDGPVSIYSPGYRNAYDVEVTEDGRVWTYDNGANNSWGGRPIGEAGDNGGATDNPQAPGYISTNLNNGEGNSNDDINLEDWNPSNKDNFHEVTRSDDLAPGASLSIGGNGPVTTFTGPDGLTYVYGGHPNPTRAEGAMAGLLFSPDAGTDNAYLLVSVFDSYNDDGDNDPMTGTDYDQVIAWLSEVEANDADFPSNGIFGAAPGALTKKVLAVEPGVLYDIYSFSDGSGQVVVAGGAAPAGGTLQGTSGIPADIAEIVAYRNKVEGDYKEAGKTDGALDTGNGSINGLAEYTSTILDEPDGTKMSGAILATVLGGGTIIIMGRNADGTMSSTTNGQGFAIAQDRTTLDSAGGPLGISTIGDDFIERGLTQPFQGSIWAAVYNGQGAPSLQVFQPNNGKVPLAGAEIVNPTDRDFDGVDHIADPFDFSDDNGYAIAPGQKIVLDFSPLNTNFTTSISGTGLLGAALDGTTPNRDAQTEAENFTGDQVLDGLFDIGGNVLPGGNAPILQIKKVIEGTVVGAANSARDVLHTGILPSADTDRITATMNVKNWIPATAGVAPGQLTGMIFGDGTQANFVRVVFGAVDLGLGAGLEPGIEVGFEIGDANYTILEQIALPALSDVAVSQLDLRLTINKEAGFAVTAEYRLEGQTAFTALDLGGVVLPEGVLRDVLTGDHTIGTGAAEQTSGAAFGFLAETSAGNDLETIDFNDLTIEAFGPPDSIAPEIVSIEVPNPPSVQDGERFAIVTLSDETGFDAADFTALDGSELVFTGIVPDDVSAPVVVLSDGGKTATLTYTLTRDDNSWPNGTGEIAIAAGAYSDAADNTTGAASAGFVLEANLASLVRGGLVRAINVGTTDATPGTLGPDLFEGGTDNNRYGGAIAADSLITDAGGNPISFEADDAAYYTSPKTNSQLNANVDGESGTTGSNSGDVDLDGSAYHTYRDSGADTWTATYSGLENGTYVVELHFAELFQTAPNTRVGDFYIQGQLVLDDFDVFAEAGGADKPISRTHNVTVTDGTITVTVDSSQGQAGYSAIAVYDAVPSDLPPTVSVGDVSVAEGADATLVFTRIGDLTDAVTIDYSVTPGSAGAGDYTAAATGQVTIPAGQGGVTLTIPTVDDADEEGAESFTVTITGVSAGATIGDGSATVTIQPSDSGLQIPAGGTIFELDFENAGAPLAEGGFDAALGGAGALDPAAATSVSGGKLIVNTSDGDLSQGSATASKNDFVKAVDLSDAGLNDVYITTRFDNPFTQAVLSANGVTGADLTNGVITNYAQQGIVIATGDPATNQNAQQFTKLIFGGNGGTAVQLWSQGAAGTTQTPQITAISGAAAAPFGLYEIAQVEMSLAIDKAAGTIAQIVTFFDADGAILGGTRPAATPGFLTQAPIPMVPAVAAAIASGTAVVGVTSTDFGDFGSFEATWDFLKVSSPQFAEPDDALVSIAAPADAVEGGDTGATDLVFALSADDGLDGDLEITLSVDGTQSVETITFTGGEAAFTVPVAQDSRWNGTESVEVTIVSVGTAGYALNPSAAAATGNVTEDDPADTFAGAPVGDFSDERLAPTDVGALQLGESVIAASQQGDAAPGGRDRDFITFTVAAGQALKHLYLDGYDSAEIAPQAFMGLQAGSAITVDPVTGEPDAGQGGLLAGIVYGPDLGADLLPILAAGEPADAQGVDFPGFTLPLAAGTYTLWLNQGGPSTTLNLRLVTEALVPTVTISDATPVLEADGAQLEFALTASDATLDGQTVTITYDTEDETGLTQDVLFTGTTGTLKIDVVNDDVADGDDIVTVTLTGAGGGVLVDATPASGTVTEDDVDAGLPKGALVLAINAGPAGAIAGDAIEGIDFGADAGFSTPSSTFTDTGGGGDTNGNAAAFDGTVYETERFAKLLTYTLTQKADGTPLVNGEQYVLELYFAELYQSVVGARKFDVTLNGTEVLADDLDVFAEVGLDDPATAEVEGVYRIQTLATVVNGAITIELNANTEVGGADNAKINGLALFEASVDPTAVSVSVADVTVDEDATEATITFTRTGASTEAITIGYSTADGTATAGADFTAVSASVEIPAGGDGIVTVTIPLTGDDVEEGDETFTVTIDSATAPTNTVTVSDASATVTLTDNDAPALPVGFGPGDDLDQDGTANADDDDIDGDGLLNGEETFVYDGTNAGTALTAGQVVTLGFDTDGTPFENGLTGALLSPNKPAVPEITLANAGVSDGALNVTATTGDHFNANNTQQNALVAGFTAVEGLRVETRFAMPDFNPATSEVRDAPADFQTAGVVIGFDQNNLVKAVFGRGAAQFQLVQDNAANLGVSELLTSPVYPDGLGLADVAEVSISLEVFIDDSGAEPLAKARAFATFFDAAGLAIPGTEDLEIGEITLEDQAQVANGSKGTSLASQVLNGAVLGAGVIQTGTGANIGFDVSYQYLEITALGTPPENIAPTADPIVVPAVDETAAPVSIDLLTDANAADSDEGDVLGVEGVTVKDAAGNDVAFTLDGTILTIDPAQFAALNTGDSATVTVNYNVTDGQGGVTPNTATLTVDGVDDASVPTVSIAGTPTAPESGDDGTQTTLLFDLAYTGGANETRDVTYTVNGDARTATVTFLDGAGLLAVSVDNDDLANGTDDITVVLTGIGDNVADMVDPAATVATGTVTEDDFAPVAVADTPSTPQNTALTFDPAANDTDADGGPLVVTEIDTGATTGGTVILNGDGTVTVTPDAGFTGDIAFGYTVSDSAGNLDAAGSAAVTVTSDAIVTLSGAPSAAEAGDDGTMTTLSFTVSTDASVDGDVVVTYAVGAGTPVEKTISFTEGVGTLEVPVANDDLANADESVQVALVSTSTPGFAVDATVATGTVTEDDFAPVAVADTPVTPQDTPLTFDPAANDTDADLAAGEVLSVTAIDTAATTGGIVILNGDGTVTVTPDAGYTGEIAFGYTVEDSAGNQDATGTASVTVTAPPVLGEPVRIEAEDFSSSVVYAPQSVGSASGDEVIFLPRNGATGSATYDLAAKGVAQGTYNIEVGYYDENDGVSTVGLSLDGAPIGSITFDEDTPSNAASSLNIRSQTFFGVTVGAAGVLVLDGMSDAGEFARIDYIEFTPVEGGVDENTAPFAPFDLPDASRVQNAAFDLDAGALFADGEEDPLTFAATATTADGTLDGDLPAGVTFDTTTGVFGGAPSAPGSYVITVTANDGALSSAPEAFTLTVQETNDAPVLEAAIADQTVRAGDAVALSVAGAFSDPDGDALTYSVAGDLPPGVNFDTVTGVFGGTLDASAPARSYQVTVTATDTTGSNTAVSDTFLFNVTGSDIDTRPTVRLEAEAGTLVDGFFIEKGSRIRLLADDDGIATYDLSGIATGDYLVRVGYWDENDGESTIGVSVASDGGAAFSDGFTLDEDTPSNAASSQNFREKTLDGTLSLGANGLLTLTGQSAGNGSDWEFVRVDWIDLIPVGGGTGNFAPSEAGGGIPDTTVQGLGAIEIATTAAFADPEEDALTYALASGPDWVSVDAATGEITGTPPAAGEYDITVSAEDAANNPGILATSDFTLTVEVPDNAAPTADAIILGAVDETAAPVSIDLLADANAADGDGDTLAVDPASVTVLDQNGDPVSFTLDGATLSIDPAQFAALDAGESATVSVGYDIIDGRGGVTPNTATLSVDGVDDASVPTVSIAGTPTALESGDDGTQTTLLFDLAYTGGANETRDVTYTVNGDARTATVTFLDGAGSLAVSVDNDDLANGTDDVTIVLTGIGDNVADMVDIAARTATGTVSEDDFAPVAVADTANTAQGAPVTFDPAANDTDADGGPLVVTGIDTGATTGGTVTLNANGTVTVTPDAGFTGQIAFGYTVADSAGNLDAAGSAAVTVTGGVDTRPTVRIEAEDGTLSGGFSIESGRIRTTDAGEATYDLSTIAQGDYLVRIGYWDENDGASSVGVTMSSASAGSFSDTLALDEATPSGTFTSRNFRETTLDGVFKLGAGGLLTLTAQAQGSEIVRIDWIELIPTGAPPAGNAAPTAVTLTPVVAGIAEDTLAATKVADIAVTDDGQGANTFALTGEDAGLFEIVGNELFLKAGQTLDATANPTLDVAVTVNDANVGADPDAVSALLSIPVSEAGAAPSVSVGVGSSTTEGDPAAATLTLSAASDQPITVTLVLSSGLRADPATIGAAAGGGDLAFDATGLATLDVTIPADSLSVDVPFSIFQDNLDEADFETYEIAITAANIGASIDGAAEQVAFAPTPAEGGVLDDDAPVTTDEVVLRINAFGAEIAATDGGPVWQADLKDDPTTPEDENSPYLTGVVPGAQDRGDTQGFFGDAPDGVPAAVLGTARSSNNPFGYAIPVADIGGNGAYTVNLYLAELFPGNQIVGDRVFDITIEGDNSGVLDNFDPSSPNGGPNNLRVVSYDVTVTDGVLNIDFAQELGIGGSDNPIVNAIEVIKRGAGTPDTAAPTAAIVLGNPATSTDPLLVSVTLADASGINEATLGAEDLELTVSGFTIPDADAGIAFTGFSGGVATYTIAAPAAGWTDGLPVSVQLRAGEVADGAATPNFNDATTAALAIQVGGGGTGGGDEDTVVFRINGGGEFAAATDGGPDWLADTEAAPISFLTVTDNRSDTFGYSGDAAAIPAGVPASIFDTARSSDGVFSYDLPVDLLGGGENYEVRLYFAELFDGSTAQTGGFRSFDATLEGFVLPAFNNIDPGLKFGADAGVLVGRVNVTDGVLNIGFTQDIVQNPIINGIEVIALADEVENPGTPVDPAGALEAFAAQDDLDTGQTYNPGVTGAAVLRIMEGNNSVASSNFGNDSFEVENTGGKKISAIFIDVSSALYPDSVFDPDGQGGDNAAKDWQINTAGGTGAFIGGGTGGYFLPGVDPIANSGGSGGLSNGGYKGAMVKFNANNSSGFEGGEIVGFSGDMDPNSIAGMAKSDANGVDTGAIQGWDVGGISGHELIGSLFTVLFDDNTTASGQLGSDKSNAGSVAVASQALTPSSVSLTVNGVIPGSTGTYGGVLPSVIVTGEPGDVVRITLSKGFDPVTNDANGIADLVEARLDRYDFKVNNAFDEQSVDITIGANGTFDASGLFDYDDANGTGKGGFTGDDVAPIAFVASVMTNIGGSELAPAGPVTAPIYLTNQGGPVTGDPVDPPVLPADGYFEINGSGNNTFFKIQIEDENGTGGTNPGGKWSYLTGPDELGNQSSFQGTGYYLFGSETSEAIDNAVGGNELLEYTIFVPETALGEYTFSFLTSRDNRIDPNNTGGPNAEGEFDTDPDGTFKGDEQNDIWLNFKPASDAGNGDIEAFLSSNGANVAEPENSGFIKLFGGPQNGTFGGVSGIDGAPDNFTADINITQAGLYTIQVDGRSQGYHLDYFELYKGNNPGNGAANSAFIEGAPGGGGGTGGGGTGSGGELRKAIVAGSDDTDQNAGAGTVNLTKADVELGDGGRDIGLRFTDLDLESLEGVDILDAYIEFTARSGSSGPVSATVKLENSLNPATFSATSGPADRDTFDFTAEWTDSSVPAAGSKFRTDDLSDLIEDFLVAKSDDLGTDDDLAFVIEDNSGVRKALSFEGGAAPELVLIFDLG